MDKHFSMWLIICLLSIVSFCLKQNNVSTVFTMLYHLHFQSGQNWGNCGTCRICALFGSDCGVDRNNTMI